MSTEEKLIDNLTAQLELKDKMLKDTEAINKTLLEQAEIYESIRQADDKIIAKLEDIIETLKEKK